MRSCTIDLGGAGVRPVKVDALYGDADLNGTIASIEDTLHLSLRREGGYLGCEIVPPIGPSLLDAALLL